MAKVKRDVRVIVLVTEAEKRELERRAKRAEKHVGEIVREALSFTPRARA